MKHRFRTEKNRFVALKPNKETLIKNVFSIVLFNDTLFLDIHYRLYLLKTFIEYNNRKCYTQLIILISNQKENAGKII